jgi:hypothetical protein
MYLNKYRNVLTRPPLEMVFANLKDIAKEMVV